MNYLISEKNTVFGKFPQLARRALTLVCNSLFLCLKDKDNPPLDCSFEIKRHHTYQFLAI